MPQAKAPIPTTEVVLDSVGETALWNGTAIRFTRPLRVLALNGGRRLYFADIDWTSRVLSPTERAKALRRVALDILAAEIARLGKRAEENFATPAAMGFTAGEKRRWLALLKIFDYPAYRAAFNSPCFESGRLVGITRKGLRVLFDETEPELASYDLFPPGEEIPRLRRWTAIGAFVTRGAAGQIVQISRLERYPAPPAAE